MSIYDKQHIKESLLKLGFSRVRFLSLEQGSYLKQELRHALREKLPPKSRSITMVALSYNRREEEPINAWGELAPFARRNYYKEAVRRLKLLSSEIRSTEAYSARDFRVFVNSDLPEKMLGAACGLGFIGKNSLLISPETGSLAVIGGISLPFPIDGDPPVNGWDRPGAQCRGCKACIGACPTNAINAPGKIDRERCIQSQSSHFNLLDEYMMEVWGMRIYGCQTCQDVCPLNRNTVEAATCNIGVIGKGIELEWLLRSDEEEIKSGLKKTALAMSWIEPAALKRNAIIAAAAGDYTELIPLIKELSQSKHEIFRETALWALEKLRSRSLSES